jgi:membrane protein YdbS with pleckstrin-like domain
MIGSYPDTEQVDRNCPVCGAELIPGDTFCEQCGSPIDEAQSGPAERTLFETRPSAYRVVKSAIGVGLVSLIVSAALGYLGGRFVHVLALAGVLFLIPLIREIQRRRIDIIVTTTRLGLETGLFSRVIDDVPLHSIRNVTTKASMFQRVFGVGDVLVDSATLQGRIPLKNVRDPRRLADLILTQMHRWRSSSV